MKRHRLAGLLTSAAIVIATAVGCTTIGDNRSGSETTAPVVGVGRHEPTAADLAALKADVGAMPHVTDVDLKYNADTFENDPSWTGTVSVDTEDHEQKVKTLRAVLALWWGKGDLESGAYRLAVVGPEGTKTGGYSLGFSATILREEMEELFGPRPTPTPES